MPQMGRGGGVNAQVTFVLTSFRHLSEEGIAELKGSAEKITASEVIRIALNVSCSSHLVSPVATVRSCQ